MANRRLDLTGMRFGRLVVVGLSGGKAPYRNAVLWLCKCDCGRDKITVTASLRAGITQSCGCLQIERSKAVSTAHGHSRSRGKRSPSRTYGSWSAMLRRCYDNKAISYPHYGALGISVTKPWRDSFESFLNDMGERPDGMTLDRIDNRFGYFMANCRWATPQQQADNRINHSGPISDMRRANISAACRVAWQRRKAVAPNV